MISQDVLLGLLSLASGGTDALSFYALGVFTSAMTGNTVLFGLSLGKGRLADASDPLIAFAAYGVGVMFASLFGVTTAPAAEERRPVRRALLAETVMLGIFAGVWVARVELPVSTALARALIPMAGIAMGLQAAIAGKQNRPGINTVVFTSTLTAIVGALTDAARGRKRLHLDTIRQIAAFSLYLASAAGTGWLASHDVTLAAVPPFAWVVLALGVAMRR